MADKQDEFRIWQRLLLNVQNEIRSDEDGIARNNAAILDLKGRNEWLSRRIKENRAAEAVLQEKQSA